MDQHPVPGLSKIVTLRAYGALPAASAWDAAPIEAFCPGFERAVLYLAYRRAAAGGAVNLRVEVSPRTINLVGAPTDWYQTSLYSAAAVVAGADSSSRFQREDLLYQATGAAVESWVYGPFDIAYGVARIRVAARETGAIANPGSLEVIVCFY